MSFTYDPTTNLGKVRLLVADTDSADPTFQDDEVQAALDMNSSAFLFVSGAGFGASFNPSPVVYSVWRAAATLLRSRSAVMAAGSLVTQLLDVKLSPEKSALALKDLAQVYMDMEDRSGSFAIAEMVPNVFAARERICKQFQRQYA